MEMITKVSTLKKNNTLIYTLRIKKKNERKYFESGVK